MRPTLLAVLLLAACEAPITSTKVSGTASGVSFTNPAAIGKDPSGNGSIYDPAPVVLITDASLPCQRTVSGGLFAIDGVNDSSGNRAAALILHGSSSAFLDTGTTRLTGSKVTIDAVETRDDGTMVGRFDVTFGSERLTGTYVATPCARLNTGCSATGGLSFALLSALVLKRRARPSALLALRPR